MKKICIIYLYLATIFACIMLLIIASLLPSNGVHRHVRESAEFIWNEGVYPRIADKTYSARMDNYTEAIMLMESDLMTEDNIASVLTNPRYDYKGAENPTDDLIRYAQHEEPTSIVSYNRYWMGFRAVLRGLLLLMNIQQIRTYMSFAFIVLFLIVVLHVAKYLDNKMALAFALSVICIKPNVVGVSLQFSCCFFIAFIAMLLVPWIFEHSEYEGLFFMEIGMLTMYFDFYTTPIVTYGMPMIYLYLLYAQKDRKYSAVKIIKNAAIWMGSYLSMWIAKLLLTEIFTSKPAFVPAFSKLFLWLGVEGYRRKNKEYNSWIAMKEIFNVVAIDEVGKSLICVAAVLLAAVVLIRFKKGIINVESFRRCFVNYSPLLMVAVLPLVWFFVGAEPATTHAWFQYRGIVVFFWGMGALWVKLLGAQAKLIQK